MKHLNPSGVAAARDEEPLAVPYRRARDCDAQAAFGATVGLNRPVDAGTAEEIMSTVIECVVAPGYEEGALDILRSGASRKRNRELRVVQVGNLDALARHDGDDLTGLAEVRVLTDGCLVVSTPLVSRVRSAQDLLPAATSHPQRGAIACERSPSPSEADDLVFAWHVAVQVRSNAVVIAKSRATLGVGTGEQDRIGALEQAVGKYRRKYQGEDSLEGAVLASDGYFAFRDCVEAAAQAGLTAIVQPGGSLNDYEVIQACNEAGIALVFTGERCFSHH
jgi:AICAR transformylase/IMP cyclohydrolase PurH